MDRLEYKERIMEIVNEITEENQLRKIWLLLVGMKGGSVE